MLPSMLNSAPQHLVGSVTRLSDLFNFGPLFKAFGNNYFAQISHILGNFCKGVKIYHFGATFIDIGQFFKVLADQFPFKTSLNVWRLFGLF